MYQLISRFDSAVQRHVDATTHSFMRALGISKGACRFLYYMLLELALVTMATIPTNEGGLHGVPGFPLVVTILFIAASLFYRADRMAESTTHTMSRSDAFFIKNARLNKTIFWFLLVLVLTRLMTAWQVHARASGTLVTLFALVPWLMITYLGSTPPKLPPQELRLPMGNRELVPVPIPIRVHDHDRR